MTSTFTPPYSPTIRHLTLSTTTSHALFVFESHPDLDPQTSPRIHRFYQENHCYSPMDNGKVIGHGLSPKCALVINAGAGDLVAITERLSGSSKLLWRYYRIGKNLEILPLDPDNRKLSREEINRLLKPDPEISGSLLIHEDNIDNIFSNTQPSWLQTILDAQLLHWYQHNPPNYYRHTTRKLSHSELQRCVDLAPYHALAKWKIRLNNAQIDQAVRTNSEGAVRFAVSDIPASLREDYLQRHASWALQDAAALSCTELALCAKEDSKSALQHRSKFPPKRKAVTLANSYYVFWTERNDELLKEFRLEVLESISGFPQEWIASHEGSFGKLVKELRLYLSLELDGAALAGLLKCTNLTDRTAIAGYIASRV